MAKNLQQAQGLFFLRALFYLGCLPYCWVAGLGWSSLRELGC